MEAQSDITKLFKDNKIYKVLTWDNRMTTIKYLLAINLFFYFYIVRENSLFNLFCRLALITLIYRMFVPVTQKKDSDQEDELLSEDNIKQLYVIVYVALNKGIQFLRDIIQMKDGKTSVFVRF